ncbi:Glycosyl transferase family 31 protein [Dioscorea alata]|nr:Glycosyl transferase family 31 protein [Dioscorea alata]KAH7667262.1 Glycosyl transferase family 31 protein [Dioscorea alata]
MELVGLGQNKRKGIRLWDSLGSRWGLVLLGRRQSLRKTWFPSDREGLRRLEASTGLAFRFVIGWTGDQRKMASLFKKKLKNMMIFCRWISKNNTAISHTKPFALFDTDFYVKADDDIYLRPDEGKPVDDGSKESLPAVHVAQVPESGKNSAREEVMIWFLTMLSTCKSSR